MKAGFCGITPDELSIILGGESTGERYAMKIVTNFYRRRIHDFQDMTNIQKSLRTYLSGKFVSGLSSPLKSESSADMSVKYLFSCAGDRIHESVYIPEKGRITICVSTQSGCRMGCPFCVTGSMRFNGNLSAGEIVNQVISTPGSEGVTHVVFMGMGEPLDNTDEVIKACRILTAGWGLSLSPTHITVSTVGLTDGVRRFLNESDCNLTFSLLSPFSDERMSVVPAEKKWPSSEIIEMISAYPSPKKRRFTIGYLMMEGINDSDRHLAELIKIVKGTGMRVNILPYHRVDGNGPFPSGQARINLFRNILMQSGISASVRRSRGGDISAACGMLAGKNK
ncbi:MAG TPA: 23S rRNA (adenine(2503)-C(2))-methyltransferase RlmN [Bacteroidales bacterium]|nr:23S rRNA (adenine(2503)-C(2))-methyltransferase RlmN [Bacteroidales bacterium]